MPKLYQLLGGEGAAGKPPPSLASKFGKHHSSTLTRLDVASCGKQRSQEPEVRGVLSTAGGLVFSGFAGQPLTAFDNRSSALL